MPVIHAAGFAPLRKVSALDSAFDSGEFGSDICGTYRILAMLVFAMMKW
jgi:hypothetical protein